MYAPQTEAKEGCAGAVEYWNSAAVNFGMLPPPYVKGQPPYDSEKNVSFLALFNSKPNATIDCAFVTCSRHMRLQEIAMSQLSAAEGEEGSESGVPSTDDILHADENVFSLVCLTTPSALTENKVPLT